MTKSIQRIASFAFGIVFILAILALALFVPDPTPFQYLAFRIVLSLALAAAVVTLTGFTKVTVSNWTSAVGALALFATAYFYNPTSLVSPPPDGRSISIPTGQTFAKIVQDIASSEQTSIEWIACPDELKRAPIKAGNIFAADGRRLIESAGKRTPNPNQIKRVILDDKGRKYTIYCN
ncbi:MAG: hypothetical protein MUP09_01185 [Thiovulaceae bacterium]|nr:hypothetical protein [Sulfurimonadaceae bacterium]